MSSLLQDFKASSLLSQEFLEKVGINLVRVIKDYFHDNNGNLRFVYEGGYVEDEEFAYYIKSEDHFISNFLLEEKVSLNYLGRELRPLP